MTLTQISPRLHQSVQNSDIIQGGCKPNDSEGQLAEEVSRVVQHYLCHIPWPRPRDDAFFPRLVLDHVLSSRFLGLHTLMTYSANTVLVGPNAQPPPLPQDLGTRWLAALPMAAPPCRSMGFEHTKHQESSTMNVVYTVYQILKEKVCGWVSGVVCFHP